MKDFLVSYRLSGDSFGTAVGDIVVKLNDGPLMSSTVQLFRKIIAKGLPAEYAGASVVILNIVPLEQPEPASVEPSPTEMILRQRLSDLATFLGQDRGTHTQIGSWNAAKRIKAILDSEQP